MEEIEPELSSIEADYKYWTLTFRSAFVAGDLHSSAKSKDLKILRYLVG